MTKAHGRSGETDIDQGITLFNQHDFFNAHEVWEDLWRVATRRTKQTIQGMVQVAVAMHHSSTGNWEGARSVMERALQNLEDAPNEFHGIDMRQLRDDVRGTIQQLRSGSSITFFRIVKT